MKRILCFLLCLLLFMLPLAGCKGTAEGDGDNTPVLLQPNELPSTRSVSDMQNIYLSQSKGMISMKKWLSLSLALCMLLSLFCGTAVFAADTQYETVTLNGFTDWTQAELDSSSGNNGYANGCSAALTAHICRRC